MRDNGLAGLLGYLRRDPAARAELETLQSKGELPDWAGARGFDLSTRDVDELWSSLCELADEELDKVAGGEEAWGGTGGGTGGGGTSGPGGTGGTGG